MKMYAVECMETLLNDGNVNIRGVGAIRPSIIIKGTYCMKEIF